MRDDVALPQSSRKRHAGLGGVLTAAGAVGMGIGLFFDVPQAGWLVGAGIVAVFVGVALLAPVIGPPIVRVISAGFPRFFGTVGRLARENAQRNPRRTAATASALMIGLALVAAMAVLGQSANKSIDKALDDGLDADFVVSNAIGQPFSPAVAEQIAQLDGVDEVAQVRYNGAQVDGASVFVAAFDPAAFTQAVNFDISAGELTLGSGRRAGVRELRRGTTGWVSATRCRWPFPAGTSSFRSPASTHRASSSPTCRRAGHAGGRLASARPILLVYVVEEQDTDLAAVKSGIDEVTAEVPLIAVKDQEGFKAEQRSQVNQLLYPGVRAARVGDHHRGARHRQHTGLVSARAHPGDRPAAGGRAVSAPAAPNGSAGVDCDRRSRCRARHGAGGCVRNRASALAGRRRPGSAGGALGSAARSSSCWPGVVGVLAALWPAQPCRPARRAACHHDRVEIRSDPRRRAQGGRRSGRLGPGHDSGGASSTTASTTASARGAISPASMCSAQ